MRVFVAGHRELVGSALWRHLQSEGFTNLLDAPRTSLIYGQRLDARVLRGSCATGEFPAIRKQARRDGAEIYFGDEAGMRTDHHADTTWVPVGQTPVVEVTGERDGVTMISAVSLRGSLHFEVFFGRFNVAVFVEFLTKLMHDALGPVSLILDNLSVHKAKIVTDYVDSLDGRLKLFLLPSYSPDLNPDEWAWKNVRPHRHRTQVRTIKSRHTRPATPATIAEDCPLFLLRPVTGLHRNLTRAH